MATLPQSIGNGSLGNVVGLIRSISPPAKKYVLWAKQIDPEGDPDATVLHSWNAATGAWEPLNDFEPIAANIFGLGNSQFLSARAAILFLLERAANQTVATTLPTPAAPRIISQNDTNNTILFEAPSGTLITDCGYSIKGAATVATTSSTISLGDVALAPNDVRIFVRATSTNNEGRSVYNSAPFTVAQVGNITPAAPTLVAQNDTADTFKFAPPQGYTPTQCVYTLKGSAPQFCPSDTLQIGNIDVAAGELQIYVPAGPGQNRGDLLSNLTPFTALTGPVTTAPSPVTQLDPTAGAGQVTVAIEAPDNGGSPILSYRYEYKLASASTWSVAATTANLSYAVTGLTNGSAYQFRSFATNSVGTSDAGTVVSATPVASSAELATPADPKGEPVSITSTRQTASTVPNATGYKLFRSTSQAGPYAQVGGTLSMPDYTDTTLSPATTYWWKWQATSNVTTYTDSAQSAAFSAATPTPKGTIEIRGGGATQSNFAGAAPRELMASSYYIDNIRAYGLSIPRNAVEKWSLGTLINGIPNQATANDNGLYPYTFDPYGGHGPAPAYVKQWLADNADNAKSLLFYTLDVTTPDSVNSTTTRWFDILLPQWKAEWTKMVALLRAQGWTGIRVILYHDLGEGNAMTPGELDNYYDDMVNLIGQMESHIVSFAGPGFTSSVLGHGILWKQQNWGSFNIAADINPYQAQLVANVAKAFKVEMPNVDVVTSFQDQYGNGTRVHYTSPEILRLGTYMATVEKSLDIGVVFKEEFNDAASLANNWTTEGFFGTPGDVQVTGGKLRITPLANTAGVNVTGFRTNSFFNFSGRRWVIDVTQGLTTSSGDIAVCVQTQLGDNSVQVYIIVEGPSVYMFDGSVQASPIVAYDAPTMRFLAIRATATEMLWQSSPDGIIWRTLASKSLNQLNVQGFNIASVYLSIFANTFASVPDPGTFIVESAKLEIV